MDRFLKTCKFSRLNHEELENQNKIITRKMVSVIQNVPANKSLGWDSFTDEFYQTLEELCKFFSNTFKNRGKHFPNHFMRPVLLCYKNREWTTKKEKNRPISLMSIYAKILIKILVKQSQCFKSIKCYD